MLFYHKPIDYIIRVTSVQDDSIHSPLDQHSTIICDRKK